MEQAHLCAEAQQTAQEAEERAAADEDSDSSWSLDTLPDFGAFRVPSMSAVPLPGCVYNVSIEHR